MARLSFWLKAGCGLQLPPGSFVGKLRLTVCFLVTSRVAPFALPRTPSRALELAHASNNRVVVGVDDCGRGAIAGPVFAAAVHLPAQISLPVRVADAKLLTRSEREQAFAVLQAVGMMSVCAAVPVAEIDCTDHRAATAAVMAKAVQRLLAKYPSSFPANATAHAFCLVDGDTMPAGLYGIALPQGDRTELCIAAASIVARIRRDAVMRSLHRRWPEFEFFINGGHASREHLRAIVAFGPCEAHRASCFPFSRPRHRLAYHPHRHSYSQVQAQFRRAEHLCVDEVTARPVAEVRHREGLVGSPTHRLRAITTHSTENSRVEADSDAAEDRSVRYAAMYRRFWSRSSKGQHSRRRYDESAPSATALGLFPAQGPSTPSKRSRRRLRTKSDRPRCDHIRSRH